MKLGSLAIAISFIVTACLFWYVNAANGLAFLRNGNDVAVVVLLGALPWFLALKKSLSAPTDTNAWIFSLLNLAAALLLLGSMPSGDAVSYNSALLLVIFWGSYGLSRILTRTKSNEKQ